MNDNVTMDLLKIVLFYSLLFLLSAAIVLIDASSNGNSSLFSASRPAARGTGLHIASHATAGRDDMQGDSALPATQQSLN